jgi:hypothetical protein
MPCNMDQPIPHFTNAGEAYSWLRRQIGNGTPITISMQMTGVAESLAVEDWLVFLGKDLWSSRCLRCTTWLAYDHWKKAQLAKVEARN